MTLPRLKRSVIGAEAVWGLFSSKTSRVSRPAFHARAGRPPAGPMRNLELQMEQLRAEIEHMRSEIWQMGMIARRRQGTFMVLLQQCRELNERMRELERRETAATRAAGLVLPQ